MGRQSEQIVVGHHWARIVEVTHSENPEKVFEITVDSQERDKSIRWSVYRSERLASLYEN